MDDDALELGSKLTQAPEAMLWKRLMIYGAPVALALLCLEAFRCMERNRPQRRADEIVLATAELPDHLNPFREGNETAETIERCLFDRLLERDESFKIEPRLAVSWDISASARFFFVSKRHAEEALAAITAAQDKWEQWGRRGIAGR